MRRAVAALAMAALLGSMLPSRLSAQSERTSSPSAAAPAVLLRLKAGEFDLVKLAADAAPGLEAGEKGLYVVQFKERITREARALLTGAGIEVGGYLPENAYLARMAPKQAALVSAEGAVRAVARYRPEWKAPAIAPKKGAELDLFVEAFPGTEAELTAAAKALGAAEITQGRSGLYLRLPESRLAGLLESEATVFVQEVKPRKLVNDVAADLLDISGSGQVWESGLHGEGQYVGVADTGLDTGNPATLHPDFVPNLATAIARGRPGDWSDPDGHGTHVAGSVLGNGAASGGSIRGMAPAGRLVFQSILDAGGGLGGIGVLYDLLDQAYGQGARIHTNSWGVPYPWGWVYDVDAKEADEFVYNHKDLTLLFAAGNDGDYSTDPTYNTVSTPSTAKNVITVGASENLRPSLHPVADNDREIAWFSSRGNAPDGRLKPDVVAPGTFILSTKSALAPNSNFWAPYNSRYAYMGGTSMATPISAGAAALVRQYFEEVKHITPAGSLVKAAMINGAEDLGYGWMSRDQGWGRVNLTNSLYPEGGRVNWHENEANALNQGEVREYTFWVESGQIFKTTLVWSDPPAAPGAAQALINDLDLTVIGPGGESYPGNCFNGDRTTAATGCAPDTLNNVENVYIAAPVSGFYNVQVTAPRVVPGYGSQAYSLVLSGHRLSTGGLIDCTGQPDGSLAASLATAQDPAREAKLDSQPGALVEMSVENRCAQAQIGENGRYNFGLYEPGGAFWYNTSYAWPSSPGTSFTTVRLDGEDLVFGSEGAFIQPPANQDPLTNVALWQSGDLSARQTVMVTHNPATGRADASAIRYTLTNTGAGAHEVGLRIMIDTMLNDNDGAPFRVPGSGGSIEAVTHERDYLGADVPDFWQAFQDLSNPVVSAQMTMGGGDATPPDRMTIAHWGRIWGTEWDFTADESQAVTGDSAVGMWWNPQVLQPGETRTIVVYYGRPRVEATTGLTLSCPASLNHAEWSAGPFNLAAYFTNSTGADYPNVTMEVETALTLVDGDPVHTLGTITPGSSGSSAWRLQPTAAGTYTVAVRVWQTLPDGRQVLVERTGCTVVAREPAVPDNITVVGSAGTAADGTPVAIRCQPITIVADYAGMGVESVTMVVRDANGIEYTVTMTPDGAGHWSHTFVPCMVGLWASPLTIELHAHLIGGGEIVQDFQIILIDPSGVIYNANRGLDWTLPGATVTLQFFDPALNAWVNMTNEAYPGMLLPVTNPQVTGWDGLYAWDVAAGDYRVQVSRPGFAEATSPAVTVPPPVLDLHVGLTPTDTEAPVTSISLEWIGSAYRVTLSATDTGGSGVRQLSYNGQTVQGDTAEFMLTGPWPGAITYGAADHAGNEHLTVMEGIEPPQTCSDELLWQAPLSADTPANFSPNTVVPIRFSKGCDLDSSVSVRIRNAQTNQLIAGFTYGAGIWFDDATDTYGQDFDLGRYNIQSGTDLLVQVYFGGRKVGTAQVHVQ